MLGVGNVGESLAPYKDSDTFLTRNAGFTWEEVHKDAHMWEFGDSGSVIVIVNDEEPVDHVQYSLDEGKTWREYKFGERLRIHSLMTVPEDTSRKFLLIGSPPRAPDKAHAVFLDFSSVNKRPCRLIPDSISYNGPDPPLGVLNIDNSSEGDFELWSPSEEREEQCLFGRQVCWVYPLVCRMLNYNPRRCTAVASVTRNAILVSLPSLHRLSRRSVPALTWTSNGTLLSFSQILY